MYEFGSGTVWGAPVAGNLPTNPTPLKLGTLQDVSLDLSFEVKELYGQLQFPVSVARAKGKISGKAKFGRLNSNFFNQFFFGATTTQPLQMISTDLSSPAGYIISGQITVVVLHTATGGTGYAIGDTGTIAGGTAGYLATYQVLTVSAGAVVTFALTFSGSGYSTGMSIATTATSGAGTGFEVDISTVSAANTIVPAQATHILQDLGVVYASSGVPLIKVPSSPAVGQYSMVLSTGVYTFNASESATAVFNISYQYLSPVATYGFTQAVTNQVMGNSPVLTVTFHTTFNNQEFNWILWNVIFNKLSFTTKIDDYLIPEMDFMAFANAGQQVINIYGVE